MPEAKPKDAPEDVLAEVLTFTPQELRVAEAYIDLVRKQTRLTYRYLRDIVAEREADDGA